MLKKNVKKKSLLNTTTPYLHNCIVLEILEKKEREKRRMRQHAKENVSINRLNQFISAYPEEQVKFSGITKQNAEDTTPKKRRMAREDTTERESSSTPGMYFHVRVCS